MYKMMKKGMFPRIAAVMLMLTLLSTCVISGTFAKYTTNGKTSASARVAKWGVFVQSTSDIFSTEYATDDEAAESASIATSVKANSAVLAPGTTGNLGAITVTGKPEVAVAITYTADLTLTGWEDSDGNVYCPIVFNVNGTEYKIDSTNTTLALLESAVEGAIAAYTARYAPGTDLSGVATSENAPKLTWTWAFDGNDDVKDTYLANSESSSISLELNVTITQIN